MRIARIGCWACVLVIAGCGGSPVAVDTGNPSDAATDVAHETASDAGVDVPAPDITNTDGTVDAPNPDGDAGASDTPSDGDASVDAGMVLAVAVPCADAPGDVYFTPTGLPALTDAARGDVVHCALDQTLTTANVQSQVTGAGAMGVTATNGVRIYRIEFRTRRSTGADGASTARVYVPDGITAPRPVIVIGHPSDGLADSCAPSKTLTSLQNLALPFAAVGYPVIAPDYAGLGNEGTQSYLDNRDQAQTLLDGARALRKLLTPGGVTSQVAMVGHSQGGGAVLSAQALAGTYGADGTVAAVAVFAAEWETRLNSFQFVTSLSNPTSLTISYGITTPVVVELEAYAWWENFVGAGMGGAVFPTSTSARTVSAINADCLTAFGAYIQTPLGAQYHVSDWLDPATRTSFLACVTDPTSSGCAPPGQVLYQHMHDNILTGDPTGAPVLYVQGTSDVIMPPAQEAACNIAKLMTDGVSVQACTVSGASHTSVVGQDIAFVMSWVDAVLRGATRPSCSSAGLPACTP